MFFYGKLRKFLPARLHKGIYMDSPLKQEGGEAGERTITRARFKSFFQWKVKLFERQTKVNRQESRNYRSVFPRGAVQTTSHFDARNGCVTTGWHIEMFVFPRTMLTHRPARVSFPGSASPVNNTFCAGVT